MFDGRCLPINRMTSSIMCYSMVITGSLSAEVMGVNVVHWSVSWLMGRVLINGVKSLRHVSLDFNLPQIFDVFEPIVEGV